jgi:ABC-type microcin C transport system permease subunit YejE
MLIGFALGENKKKIVTYLVLPFVLVAEIIIIAFFMGFNG